MIFRTDERLPVGVIGVGHLGRHHARILSDIGGARLAGIADVDPSRNQGVAGPLGVSFTTDYRELAGKVAAVTVAVPTTAHHEVAAFFLRSGVHVLVEKPITASVEEAEDLVRIAGERNVCLMTGHIERFNPAIIVARKHLRSPRFIEAHRIGAFPNRSTDVDVVLDVMIHDIDLVLSIDRSGLESVDAVGVAVLTGSVDIANARLKLKSGCVANLTASRVSQEKLRKIRFFGAHQYLSVDCDRKTVRHVVVDESQGAGRPVISVNDLDVVAAEPLRLEIESFIRSAQTGSTPEPDGRAGLESLAAAFAVRAAIGRSGAPGTGR